MGNNLILKHKASGMIKEAKIGFSWTNFLFGSFCPLFRGDWKWFIVQMIVFPVSFGISRIIFSFIYNKIYVKDLLERGYYPADDKSELLLKRKNIIS